MYLDFIALNWHLFLALAIILLLLILEPIRTKAMGITQVSPLRVSQVVSHDNGIIVDICEKKEFSKGHIPNAQNFPLSTLKNNVEQLSKYKERPIILSCRSGNRARMAAKTLSKHGFKDLQVLSGGMLAWQKENLPVTTK